MCVKRYMYITPVIVYLLHFIPELLGKNCLFRIKITKPKYRHLYLMYEMSLQVSGSNKPCPVSFCTGSRFFLNFECRSCLLESYFNYNYIGAFNCNVGAYVSYFVKNHTWEHTRSNWHVRLMYVSFTTFNTDTCPCLSGQL